MTAAPLPSGISPARAAPAARAKTEPELSVHDRPPGEPPRAWLLGAMLAVYLCVQTPNAASLTRFVNDERFYSDAALHMLSSGDLLTPVYGQGERLRFRKPVLHYWMVAASFTVCGVNVLALRLPSLLAGAGTLWLAARLAERLFRSPTAGLLAAAMLLGNAHLLGCTQEGRPDAGLAFWLLLSQYGFAMLLFRGSESPRHHACAYLGMALAVNTKGLLGFLPAVLAWSFAFALRHRGCSPRRLWSLWLPAGLLLAGSWYGAAWLKHGGLVFSESFQDQIGQRLSHSRWLGNLFFYPALLLAVFLPWSLLGLARVFRRGLGHTEADDARPARWYLLAGVALFALIFVPANVTNARYLYPCEPWLAVLLGGLCAPWAEGKFLRGTNAALALVLALAGAVLIVLGLQGGDTGFAAAGAVALVAALAAGFGAWSRNVPSAAALACAVCLSIGGWQWGVEGALAESAAPAVAVRLMQPDAAGRTLGTFADQSHLPGHLPLLTGGRCFAEAAGPESYREYDLLLVREDKREALDLNGYRVEPAGYVLRKAELDAYAQALWQGTGPAYLARHRQAVLLAARMDPHGR